MATPHVAGAAAIVKQQHPEYTAAQLRARAHEHGDGCRAHARTRSAPAWSTSPAAIDAAVMASGSGDFGMLAWGEAPDPVVRTHRVREPRRRRGRRSSSQRAHRHDARTARSARHPTCSRSTPRRSTIPAGETRTVTLTADPAKVPAGAQLSGALVASVDGDRRRAHRARHHRRARALRPHDHRDRLRRRAHRDLRHDLEQPRRDWYELVRRRRRDHACGCRPAGTR